MALRLAALALKSAVRRYFERHNARFPPLSLAALLRVVAEKVVKDRRTDGRVLSNPRCACAPRVATPVCLITFCCLILCTSLLLFMCHTSLLCTCIYTLSRKGYICRNELLNFCNTFIHAVRLVHQHLCSFCTPGYVHYTKCHAFMYVCTQTCISISKSI